MSYDGLAERGSPGFGSKYHALGWCESNWGNSTFACIERGEFFHASKTGFTSAKFMVRHSLSRGMGTKTKGERTVKAAETAFAIVETIDELDGAGVSEVADHLSIAKSTAHKHLTTLEENEYLVRDDGTYRLSLKHLKFGRHAIDNVAIAQTAQPVIEHLATETGEAVWVAIEEHGRAVYVNKALGERAVPSRGSIGNRIHLHSAAIGKAMLAHLPRDRVEEILERHGLPELTEDTITDRGHLFEELEAVQDRGVAFNDGESLEGLRAVATPIQHDGDVMGAVAVVGTENRMKGEYFREELPDLVRGAANEIELKLAYS